MASGAFEAEANPLLLRGVLTLLVTFPPSLLTVPVEASLLCVFRLVDASSGLPLSAEGLATLPVRLELVMVAARDLVRMKLGRKDERGEAGLAGVSRGDPFGDRPVKPPVGRAMCVGRFVAVPGRDMVDDERVE